MKAEFYALIRHKIWELVHRDTNKNVVDFKWIYMMER